MVALTGYKDLILIHESANSQVYRALRVGDLQPIILKFLNQDYPTSEQIRQYKQEYYLTCQLESPGIITAYSLEKWQKSYAIALEDFGGISLRQWLKEREKLSLQEFLFLAIATTESLGQIHAKNIIHKDINPANIAFNSETKELKIIDFGIATQLSRENPTLKNPNILEGTLNYISPEQTGRMNRSLDYRTDFYSLGVTFYELLTKKLPYVTEDVLELVHFHLAKQPRSPSEIEPLIPPIISDIVMKLMSKNAEDRYQSAYGLKADLENCLKQLNLTGNIEVFPLASQDISDRFQIPQKLYGREKEIAQLLEAFERVANTGKVELMLVAGYSGIGKSCLVKELYKPITARRGYFISGKFDQFKRNIPYSAVVTAFRGLIGQILSESQAQLQIWKKKLLKVLGKNGQIIIDVIPEVELIIGKQPSVPTLGTNEAQNRFNLVISNFIRACCDSENPLTLFLDDLQWADSGSLKLIEKILFEEQIEYLYLLGAYRNNEISPGHPLAITLRKFQQKNHEINKITLKILPRYQIACLIGDTLNHTPEEVCNLSKLVRQKTGGNPFFINEFLSALYSEKLLQFNSKSRSWQWNIEGIEARGLTNNVVELMLEKLQKLPPSSQEILSIAACYGTEFDLNILTLVKQKSPQEIYELLKIAIDRDLIFPISELDENLLIQSYKFSHDRVQQAAYLLIPEEQKEKTHYHIGQLLLEKTPPEATIEHIFELVSQLNYGITLMTDQKQRDELAKLNLIACRKAKTAAAYEASREYGSIGLSLLGEKAWSRQYEMTLEFHDAAAELASLCGDFEVMEEFVKTVIAQTKSLLAKVNVYRIKILSKVANNQPLEAIAIAQKILQQLGVTFPKTTTQKNIQHSIAEINTLIGDREIEDLVNLPVMTDSEKIAIFQIASSIIPAAYISGSLLFPLIVSLSVKLSIQYGNTPISALMYAAYGIITCNLLQDVNTGVKFGKLAVGVVSQLDAKAVKPEALQVVAGFILHRKSHVKETLPLLQETYNNSLEVGNQDFAGHCAVVFCLHALWCGYPLTTLKQETNAYCNGLLKLNQLTTANYCRIHWQTILNLSEVTEHPSILSGEVIQETEMLSILLSAHDLYALYIFYLDKLMLCYLFEEIELAQKSAVEGRQYLVAAGGSFGEPAFYFYDSLIAIATLDSQLGETSELLNRVEENQTQLQKQWANYAPMNHQHKVDLVAAEKYRVLGQKLEAMEMYDRAIAGAKENDFSQEEALANELAAKFYLNCDREKIARVYMMDAHYCYSQWGAKAKVKHLEENYPELCQSSTAKTYANSTIINTEATSNSTNGVILDLATVVKSSNAISGEIVLEKLLATLMNIIIENAGAQRGILILPRGEDLSIEAIKEADSETVGVLQSLPLHKFKRLSSKIVHYVARTRKTVVLNNATGEGKFTNDTYIREHQCQSIACIPLINQGQLQGIIYLENNLTTGVFTRARMALLRTLAAQTAISLENARLYDACKRFVPDQFLSFLDKKSIVDVELGDQIERKMTVLFSDIRDFTTISEQMTPAENFAFINEYLGYMEPQIKYYGGFIDKYIGDAIMALFPNSADEALKAAIVMLEELKKYNSYREQINLKPIRIGIGLHTGNLILGTVGGFGRMDGTAIGDAVNLSSRVEGLTKTYRVSLLITHQTLAHIDNPLEYDLRFIDKVKAKGKAKAVGLFEVFSADPPELKETKIFTKEKFETAVLLYHRGSFEQAANLFQECLESHSGDRAARGYLERCQRHN